MISSFENIASETSLWERVRYYNLNSLYNKLKSFIKKCFDNDSKYLSDRDFFMMNNMEKPENNVYMPKQTIENKGDVIVPCQISSGTLPSVENTLNVQGTDSYYCSDISISIALDSSTTIAQFSDVVVSGNSDYQYGDQISLILAQQFNDTENDIPHTSIVALEVTLDQSDSRLLSSKSKDNAYLTCFGIYSGSLAVKVDSSSSPENLSGVSPVWVHSRLDQSGKILVSTQYMYDCNPYADAHDTALMSYDLDFTKKKFLEPQELCLN